MTAQSVIFSLQVMFRLIEINKGSGEIDCNGPVQSAALALSSLHCSTTIQGVLRRATSFDWQEWLTASDILKFFEVELFALECST